jgi:hypothetical protein
MNSLEMAPAIRDMLKTLIELEAAEANFAQAEKELQAATNADTIARKRCEEAIDGDIDTLIHGSAAGMQVFRLKRTGKTPITIKRVQALRV